MTAEGGGGEGGRRGEEKQGAQEAHRVVWRMSSLAAIWVCVFVAPKRLTLVQSMTGMSLEVDTSGGQLSMSRATFQWSNRQLSAEDDVASASRALGGLPRGRPPVQITGSLLSTVCQCGNTSLPSCTRSSFA